MDATQVTTRKVVVCTHDPKLFTHIDMCFDSVDGPTVKCELMYAGLGKVLVEEEKYHKLDVLIIDLALNDMDCIELTRTIRWADPDYMLIFLIDNPEQAIIGYELSAFRCLLKDNLYNELSNHLSAILHELGNKRHVVELLCADRTHRVFVDNILYAEAQHHTVYIYYRGRRLEPDRLFSTLSTIEEMLTPHGFYRISNSFIVNMACVVHLTHQFAMLATGVELPVGRNRYREARAIYDSIERPDIIQQQ